MTFNAHSSRQNWWHIIGITTIFVMSILSACSPASTGAKTPHTATSTPSTDSGMLYVTSTGSNPQNASATTLYAIAGSTGKQIWNAQPTGVTSPVQTPGADSSPVVLDGMLYIDSITLLPPSTITAGSQPSYTISGTLSAYNAKNGTLVRSHTTSSGYSNLFTDGKILLAVAYAGIIGGTASLQASLIALDPAKNEATLWQQSLPFSSYGAVEVAMSGDTVILGNREAGQNPIFDLAAYTVSTGKFLWKQQIHQSIMKLEAAGNSITLIDNAGFGAASVVTALDLATGITRWQKQLPNSGNLLLTTESAIYIGLDPQLTKQSPQAGAILALNPQDGVQQWSAPYQVNTALVANSASLFGIDGPTQLTGSNKPVASSIFALNSASGATVWKNTLDQSQSATSIAMSGSTIFVVITGQSGQSLTALNEVNGKTIWTFPISGFSQVQITA